jgi:Na+/phosphate symporter
MTVTKISERTFAVGFAAIVVLFAGCAFTLIVFSGIELWTAVQPGNALTLAKRFYSVLDCIAMLTIAMAAMELAQTVVEEEFDHEARLSAAARARHVLSRFLVVVIISLAIESLVAIFKFVQDDPSMISEAAHIAFAAAALLAAWGFYNKMGRADAREG